MAEPDLVSFAELVLPYLQADPVRNNVAYGVMRNRLANVVPVEPGALWLYVDDGHDIVGVALMTPAHAMLLTEMPPAAVDALAAHLADTGVRPPGVNGPADVGGRLREATQTDRELLVDWMVAFRAEALPHETRDTGTRDADAQQIDIRLGQHGLLWLWEFDGPQVSTAYLSRLFAGVVRVSGV